MWPAPTRLPLVCYLLVAQQHPLTRSLWKRRHVDCVHVCTCAPYYDFAVVIIADAASHLWHLSFVRTTVVCFVYSAKFRRLCYWDTVTSPFAFFFFLIRELDWIRHTGLAWNFCWLHANSCIIAIFSLFILFNSALSCTCMYIYRSNCSTLQLYRTTKLLFYTVSSFIFFFRSYKIFFFSHQRTCFCCCDCKILFTCFCDYWQQLLWGDMLFRVFLLHCYFLSFIFVDCPPPFLLSLVLCQ